MSVIGKKLNPIQSNLNEDSNNHSEKSISPDEVLRLSKIAEDYLCSPGKQFDFLFLFFFLM